MNTWDADQYAQGPGYRKADVTPCPCLECRFGITPVYQRKRLSGYMITAEERAELRKEQQAHAARIRKQIKPA